MDNKGLIEVYKRAGSDFLAYRMQHLLVIIESPRDIALHNDALGELMMLIKDNETFFMKQLAETILLAATKPKG